MKEDWDLLLGFLPPGWEALAAESGALKGLRKDKSPENLLRVLLLHLGCGHSLRETAVRARRAGLADLSSVALMKRLAKAGPWLHSLCRALFEERGGALSGSPDGGFEVRLVDATTVKEPGKTGSLWRLHYSVRLPSLVCDHFRLTETEGPDGGSFDLLGAVAGLDRPGHASSWPAAAGGGSVPLAPGRVCAVRKSDAAIDLAHRKLLRKASRKGTVPKPQSLEFAKYVIVFHDPPRGRLHAGGGSGLVPSEVAGGAWCSSVSSRPRSSGTFPSETAESSQGEALRQALHRPARRKADRPRERRFPLGIRPPRPAASAAGGVSSSSCSTRSAEPIEPGIPLPELLADWPAISRGLSEPPRKRRPQMERYFPIGMKTEEQKTS